MNNNRDDLQGVTPVANYEAPKIPTLSDTRSNPTLLKKLPLRWRKNAAVITCIGIIGVSALAACASPPGENLPENGGSGGYYNNYNGYTLPSIETLPNDRGNRGFPDIYNGYTELDLEFRTHHGGSGFAIYVVYLTEQEAFGIIRAQLEAAGLNFNDDPPEHTVTITFQDLEDFGWGVSDDITIGIDLFDRERGVGISHVSVGIAPQAAREFFVQHDDIFMGAFYNPSHSLRKPWVVTDDGERIWQEPTDEEIEEANTTVRPILHDHLTVQVQNFLGFLQSMGVL
ncbi:MAG: hypothetical protein FWC96_04780 [Oscillospiraceae bacterium]|nr:hypothetical protein [Oscillospiraceae bacterium]